MIASRPGVASSRSESRVTMSTTLPYSGFSVVVHDPGVLAELAAHLEDDRAGGAGDRVDRSPENRNTTAAPMISADEVARVGDVEDAEVLRGSADRRHDASAGVERLQRRVTASRNEPNSAVAASTAVAIAMPLVIAFVVLPTASRLVSTWAPSPSTSPDISAMPCALSETGPKVSIDDDDADGGQQAGTGQRDREQREHDRAAAEQEGAVHGGRR